MRKMEEFFEPDTVTIIDEAPDKIEPRQTTGKIVPVQAELFEPEEITRPELNVAKFASLIFVSPYSKNTKGIKTYQWDKRIGEQTIKASLTISPIEGRRRPTTTTFAVLLALVQIWEYQGQPADGRIVFSGRQVAAINNWRWGGETAKRIEREIAVLSGTEIKFTRAFEDKAKEARTETLKILGDSEGYLRKESRLNKEYFTAEHVVYFGDKFLQNLLAGVTKPVNHAAYISIKNDSAANLYAKLDVYLANKAGRPWKRRALPLITVDLELAGKRYEQKKHRLAKLKELKKALDNKELAHGKLRVRIEDTADKQDYNLVAWKEPRIVKDRSPKKLANPREDWGMIIDAVCQKLGVSLGSGPGYLHQRYLEVLVMWYPKELLLDAAAIAKADYQGRIRTHITKVFTDEVHRHVHMRGLEWVRKESCGPDCKWKKSKAA